MHLYWSAFQAFAEQINPYHPENLLVVKSGHSFPFVIATVPWAFILLAPILMFSFKTAALFLLIINLFVIYALYKLVPKLFDIKDFDPSACALAAILFIPNAHLFLMGQFTLIISFFLVAMCLALKARQDIIAGILFLPLTIKPHLSYLFLAMIFYVGFREGRWKFMWSLSVSAISLGVITHFCNSQIYSEWLNLRSSPLIWMGSTIATPIRLLLIDSNGVVPRWPAVVIPMITLISSIFCLRKVSSLDQLLKLTPFLICLSLFSAPYGWLYDQTLILFVQIAIVARATASPNPNVKSELIIYIIWLQGISSMLFYHCINWCFFWFPLAMLLIWLRADSLEGSSSIKHS